MWGYKIMSEISSRIQNGSLKSRAPPGTLTCSHLIMSHHSSRIQHHSGHVTAGSGGGDLVGYACVWGGGGGA